MIEFNAERFAEDARFAKVVDLPTGVPALMIGGQCIEVKAGMDTHQWVDAIASALRNGSGPKMEA